jgi:chaperonin cofactor prefoldin
MNDKEILEKINRLDNHFKVYKQDMQDVKDSLKEVRSLLGGSTLNGNKGFIHLMETVEEKADTMQTKIELMQKDIDSIKFWGRGASGLLFASILVLINYIKDKL